MRETGEFDRRTWFVREILAEETRLRAILRRFFPLPVDLADGIQETYARLLELPDNGPSAVEVLSRREELDLMHRAIAALPDRCRRVLVLRRLQGVSQKEIAVRLGISENTVEKHASNGARLCARYCVTERGRGAIRMGSAAADARA